MSALKKFFFKDEDRDEAGRKVQVLPDFSDTDAGAAAESENFLEVSRENADESAEVPDSVATLVCLHDS